MPAQIKVYFSFFICAVAGVMEIVANLEADRTGFYFGRRIINRSQCMLELWFFISGLIGAGIAQLVASKINP